MAIDVKRYQHLKQEAEELQRQADRAHGALDGVMKQLKEEFDCDTLEEAEERQKELQKEAKKAEKTFNEALEDFEDKWGSVLDGMER